MASRDDRVPSRGGSRPRSVGSRTDPVASVSLPTIAPAADGDYVSEGYESQRDRNEAGSNGNGKSRASSSQPALLSETEWLEMNAALSAAEKYDQDADSVNILPYSLQVLRENRSQAYRRAATPATRYFKHRANKLHKWSHKFYMEHDDKDVPVDLSLPNYTLMGMMTKLAIEAQMDSHKAIVENSRKRVDTQPPEALEWMLKRTKQRLVNRLPGLDVSRSIKNHSTPTALHHIQLHHRWHDEMLKRVKGHVRTRHTDPHIITYFKHQKRRKRKEQNRKRQRNSRAGLFMSSALPPQRKSPFPEVRAVEKKRKPPKIYVLKKKRVAKSRSRPTRALRTPNLSKPAKTSMIYSKRRETE